MGVLFTEGENLLNNIYVDQESEMKKIVFLFMVISSVLAFSGCAVMELADMIFDDDCQYRGTVSEVSHTDDTTTVKFEDSTKTFTCDHAGWVDAGDWIEVRSTEDGCIFDY